MLHNGDWYVDSKAARKRRKRQTRGYNPTHTVIQYGYSDNYHAKVDFFLITSVFMPLLSGVGITLASWARLKIEKEVERVRQDLPTQRRRMYAPAAPPTPGASERTTYKETMQRT